MNHNSPTRETANPTRWPQKRDGPTGTEGCCSYFHIDVRQDFQFLFVFDAGEEGSGFEAEEFGDPSGVGKISAGLFRPQFNILPFAELHALFDEDFLSRVDSS